MTRDEIAQAMHDTAGSDWGNEAHFQRFAALIAAAEREECARLCEQPCDEIQITDDISERIYRDAFECAEAIRARGE